jgi:DNA-binding NarL/FixJ family response regulator
VNPAASVITVALVDDDPEFRRLVQDTLTGQPDLSLAGEFGDAATALETLPTQPPDIVLMDIELPGLSGIECVRRLRSLMPGTRFMMLTVFEAYDRIFESLQAGATGYLIKKGVATRLADAVRDLHAGQSPISPSIARKVIQTFLGGVPADELSPREREILERLARGRQYKEIAEELGVSFHTIRTHVQHIYKKLHVRSKAEAVRRLPGGPSSENFG